MPLAQHAKLSAQQRLLPSGHAFMLWPGEPHEDEVEPAERQRILVRVLDVSWPRTTQHDEPRPLDGEARP